MNLEKIAVEISSKLSFLKALAIGTVMVFVAVTYNTFKADETPKELMLPPSSSEKICDETQIVSMPMGGTTGSKFAPENKNPRKHKVDISAHVDQKSNEIFLNYIPEGFDKKRSSSRMPLEKDYAVINSSQTGALINMPPCAKIEKQDQQSWGISKRKWDTNMKLLKDHPEAKMALAGGEIILKAFGSRTPSEKVIKKFVEYSEKNNLSNMKPIANLFSEKLIGDVEGARKTRIKLNLESCIGDVHMVVLSGVRLGREYDSNRQGNFGYGGIEGIISFKMQGEMTEEEGGKKDYIENLREGVGLEMVWIPKGKFKMGSKNKETLESERPIHKVKLDGFYMGKYEITNEQYRKFNPNHDSGKYSVFGKTTPVTGKKDTYYLPTIRSFSLNEKDQPVCANWNEARNFCDWLSQKTGRKYTLPTEAQWEYACRANTTTEYYWGKESSVVSQYANIIDRSAHKNSNLFSYITTSDGYVVASPVGKFKPNNFGLYDMIGNACEWCLDKYTKEDLKEYYKKSPYKNPQGPGKGNLRILRGGNWHVNSLNRVICSYRNSGKIESSSWGVGFRVVSIPN